jgi:hypothetical protein
LKYQYSNAGYVPLGSIIEDVAGQPLPQFLAARDLFFSQAVQAIPDSGFLTNVRCHHPGLFDDEVLRRSATT